MYFNQKISRSHAIRNFDIIFVSVAFVIYTGFCSINYTKTKLAASLSFLVILRNKWITETRYRTADTKKPRGNAILRRLACSVAWNLSFSVFPRVALPFLQFALLHSVTCVQLRLKKVLGNCGCVAVASGHTSSTKMCFSFPYSFRITNDPSG
jgi:hypothetical protein